MQKVKGSIIDAHTRCTHYHSELDIIAIKFKCCNTYYSCIYCHNEEKNHEVLVWSKEEFNETAILCGNCQLEFSIYTYLNSNNICPNCDSNFNPKCSNHYHYYFET